MRPVCPSVCRSVCPVGRLVGVASLVGVGAVVGRAVVAVGDFGVDEGGGCVAGDAAVPVGVPGAESSEAGMAVIAAVAVGSAAGCRLRGGGGCARCARVARREEAVRARWRRGGRRRWRFRRRWCGRRGARAACRDSGRGAHHADQQRGNPCSRGRPIAASAGSRRNSACRLPRCAPQRGSCLPLHPYAPPPTASTPLDGRRLAAVHSYHAQAQTCTFASATAAT